MTTLVDPARLKITLAQAFKEADCDFALLGGSVAAGTAGWWSDVDIFIHVAGSENDDVKARRIMRLMPILMDLAGTDRIDLHDLDTLPVGVQYNAIKGGIVLFEVDDGTARANFVENMLREYYEINPWYEALIEARLQARNADSRE